MGSNIEKHGTILHLAVRDENVEAVRFLLGTNVDVNLDENGRKRTSKRSKKSPEDVVVLDSDSSEDSDSDFLESEERDSETPIALACRMGNQELVKTLLGHLRPKVKLERLEDRKTLI